MKLKITIFACLLVLTATVLGIPVLPFPGWNEVKQKSPTIIIAQCLKTVDDPSDTIRGLIDSDIQILSVLKGNTNIGSAHLRSMYWPRKGEKYLIFLIAHDGVYDAIDNYRFVPLGMHFSPDSIKGKTLDEQIQILFQQRLNYLDQQMKEEQEERQRLASGLPPI